MPNTPDKPSGKSDDFFLDGSPDTAEPHFKLEPDALDPPSLDIQAELQLSIDNPEQPERDAQFEFDGMAKPIYAIRLETGNEENKGLHFQNAPTLLESLEAQSIQVPYQCRDGYCGACRCKKLSGEVTYIKEPMAWINDDEILPCVSIPKTDLKLKLKG